MEVGGDGRHLYNLFMKKYFPFLVSFYLKKSRLQGREVRRKTAMNFRIRKGENFN